MKPHITIFPDRPALMSGAADAVLAAGQAAIRERGRWMWCLAGGSTPGGTYELLARSPRREQLDWRRVHVFWGDERCVLPDDPESNYGMARRALLDHVPIPAANIHRVRGEAAPETAAHLYSRDLRAAFDLDPHQWPIFDTVLLGLGNDGHTASLFPGSDILERREALAAETWVSKLGQFRISLTLPTLNHARQVIFLVAGADKAQIVCDVLRGPNATGATHPAMRIEPATPVVWLLDAEAARQVPSALLPR